MAKYVEYTPDVFAVQDGGVHVYWFPETFSQSQLHDRIIGSNACTLIAVLVAGRLDEFNIPIWGYFDQPLNRMLVTSIAEAIVEGNEIHESLMMRGELYDMDLTVPEALNAVHFKYPGLVEWIDKTTLVMDSPKGIGESLAQSLRPCITEFELNPPENKRESSDLYIVLVSNGRSVLFVYQSRTSKITLIDSHAHLQCQAGAVVAQARFGDLNQLSNWYTAMCATAFSNWTPNAPYELAYLYFRG